MSVLVHSSSQRTDAKAVFSANTITHTSFGITWKNVSSQTSTFRVFHRETGGTWKYSPDLAVSPNATKHHHFTGLKPNKQHDVLVQRKENGSWRAQDSNGGATTLNVTTHALTHTVSTSIRAVEFKWLKKYTGTYLVEIYSTSNTTTATRIKERSGSWITESGGWFGTIVAGLGHDTTYYAVIKALEAVNSSNGKDYVTLATFPFNTSEPVAISADVVLASSVKLSWDGTAAGDDEQDGVAEFRIQQFYRNEDGSWSSGTIPMDWAPDTTKSFTATDLVPGKEHLFRLYRMGVDGAAMKNHEIKVFTLSTDLDFVGPTTSTRANLTWSSIYEGAKYRVRYTPSGGTPRTYGHASGTTGIGATLTNLLPGTDYTLELLVIENGAEAVVSTRTTKTRELPTFSAVDVGHTSIEMEVYNPLPDPTWFYFTVNGGTHVGSFLVQGEQTSTRHIDNRVPGITYSILLRMREFGNWVSNPAPTSITTRTAPDLNTSISTFAAMVKWDEGYPSADYRLELFDGEIGAGGESVKIFEGGAGIKIEPDGQLSATATSLDKATDYHAVLSVREMSVARALVAKKLREVAITTSHSATFRPGTVLASSVQLSWTPTEVLEEDGVAEFMVTQKEYPSGPWSTSTGWIPHSTTQTKIAGLKPGTTYRFLLTRMGVDGVSKDEAFFNVTTKGSALTVGTVTADSMDVSWGEVYSGAQYLLKYTASGGSPVTFSGSSVPQTSATLTGLSPGTDYTLELFVVEEGGMVGTSSVRLGSGAESGKNDSSYGMVSLVVLLMALVVAFITASRTRRP
jgi:hypothetical protein